MLNIASPLRVWACPAESIPTWSAICVAMAFGAIGTARAFRWTHQCLFNGSDGTQGPGSVGSSARFTIRLNGGEPTRESSQRPTTECGARMAIMAPMTITQNAARPIDRKTRPISRMARMAMPTTMAQWMMTIGALVSLLSAVIGGRQRSENKPPKEENGKHSPCLAYYRNPELGEKAGEATLAGNRVVAPSGSYSAILAP